MWVSTSLCIQQEGGETYRTEVLWGDVGGLAGLRYKYYRNINKYYLTQQTHHAGSNQNWKCFYLISKI